MAGRKDERTVTVETASGPVRVHADSLIALVSDPSNLDRERLDRIDRGVMAWSLGKFADLLWMVVPESREMIVELACRELKDSLRMGAFLTPVSAYSLANSLYVELVRPALDDLPAENDVLRRVLGVVRRTLVEDDTDYHWDALNIELLRPLVVDGGDEVLSALDPQLAEIYRKRSR